MVQRDVVEGMVEYDGRRSARLLSNKRPVFRFNGVGAVSVVTTPHTAMRIMIHRMDLLNTCGFHPVSRIIIIVPADLHHIRALPMKRFGDELIKRCFLLDAFDKTRPTNSQKRSDAFHNSWVGK